MIMWAQPDHIGNFHSQAPTTFIFTLSFAVVALEISSNETQTESNVGPRVIPELWDFFEVPPLPSLQELPLPGDKECNSVEDCYGYNVKVFGCKSGKCLYSKSTYTVCSSDADCHIYNHTSCKEEYCVCHVGYGIHKFVMDLCVPIPPPDKRWMYESKRDPERIAKMRAWGSGDEYPPLEKYSALIIGGAVGITCTMLATMIGQCLRNRRSSRTRAPQKVAEEEARTRPIYIIYQGDEPKAISDETRSRRLASLGPNEEIDNLLNKIIRSKNMTVQTTTAATHTASLEMTATSQASPTKQSDNQETKLQASDPPSTPGSQAKETEAVGQPIKLSDSKSQK